MKMKKVWALLVSLMLVASMALPVALAVSDDQGASAAAVSSEEGTPPAEEQVEQKEADPKPEQDDQESDSQEQDGKESGENQCTCGAAEGEAHAADCPLYEKPEADKADENAALYQKFLAAKTMEEANALYNGLSKEEVTAFRTWLEENNKLTALEQHLSAITPEGEPVTMPIVSFTKVGPLLAAPARKARMMRAAADQDDTGADQDDTGIVLNKSAKSLGNDSYQITLEAYATGASSTTISTEPADIVLVLDVSGSMDDKMTQYQKVYAKELDKDKHYYVEKNGQYQEIHWREQPVNSWGNWFDSYTPKESAADSNRNHVQFYQLTISQETKLHSLQNAVNNFITSVADKSPDSNIALVKFAGRKTDRVGNNTYRDSRYTYNYTQVVRGLTAASDSQSLKNDVNKLQPAGATRADYGMELAKNIINSSDVANNGRKKTVIMFTDGEPTDGTEFEIPVANAAISASKGMKDVGATVYTIGVFSGANGTPVNSWEGVSDTNKYMHLVSSNYKNANNMYASANTATYPEGGKSYFLSAGSADELSSIFQQISQEVGGSTSNLDASATIKDIVTPYFDMPNDVKDVEVYTAESNGRTDNTINWKDKVPFNDGNVSIQGNTVSVSGFSYKDNWCGPGSNGFNNGKKLIIQFNVTAKDGFLGGNDVPTNEKSTSGIYDKDGKEVKPFEQPTVNVPIKEVKVTAEDKNVYLLGDVTTEQLKTGATVTVKCGDKCGKVTLDLSKADDNYGLAAWQNAYVDIEAGIKDQDGKALTNGYTGLTEDTTYIVSVAVKPNDPGTTTPEKGAAATEQTGQATGKINVFTPELTFKDGNAYYGETVSTDFTANKVEDTVWKHGDTASTDVTMLVETAPTLDITYTPDESTVKDNKYTKQDAAVKATVKINGTDVTQYTTFQHENCNPACDWKNPDAVGDPAFLIHIKTCQLTITKAGGATDEPYVFNIRKDGKEYSEVTICGNGTKTLYELPVGTYTIQEDTGWSWRFTPTYSGNNEVKLSPTLDKGSITCTNTKDKDKWINGFSDVKNNIFKKVATN